MLLVIQVTEKKRFCVTMDEDVVTKIDKIRGLIPRATFINEVMKANVMPDSRPKQAGITATPSQ